MINTSLTSLDLEGDEKEMKWKKREREREREEKNKRTNKQTKKEMKWIDNYIRDEGAQTLSEALKINTSMTSLNLRGDENEMKWSDGRRERKAQMIEKGTK